MAFEKNTWKDRLVEYAGRRKITNVSTGSSQIVDVERSEGIVSEEGSAFSAANMNDLEQRIADEFDAVNNNLSFPDGVGFYPDVQDGQRGYNTDAARGADTFHPFSRGLTPIKAVFGMATHGGIPVCTVCIGFKNTLKEISWNKTYTYSSSDTIAEVGIYGCNDDDCMDYIGSGWHPEPSSPWVLIGDSGICQISEYKYIAIRFHLDYASQTVYDFLT